MRSRNWKNNFFNLVWSLKSQVGRREIQQKFNNFAEKFVSPPPYGVEEPVNNLLHFLGWKSIKIVITS